MMTESEAILFDALEFIAHHNDGDQGKSHREVARKAIQRWWMQILDEDRADRL